MRPFLFPTIFLALAVAAFADPAADAAAARVGNTVIATEADGYATHIYWRAGGTFWAWSSDWKSEGKWFVKDGQLCLTYDIARPRLGASECMAKPAAHKVGEVWKTDGRTVTLAGGAVLDPADPMASRYGNTTIATDPDGTTTKLYYRFDHSFTAKRGDWSSEGAWAIENGKLCLTYKIERPGVGTHECVSSEAHKIGETWVHNGRTIILVEGVK